MERRRLKFQGEIIVENAENAKQIWAESREDGQTVWIDGSRMDDGNVGCAVVRRIGEGEIENSIEGWNLVGYHLGTGNEVFDAELCVILKATRRFAISKEFNKNFTIFSDSQAAILTCRNDCHGPGQSMARAVIQWSQQVVQKGNTLTIRWVPGHADIDGNEVADKQTKRVAQHLAAAVRYEPDIMKFTSISRLRRRAKEAWAGCKEWIEEHCRRRKSYLRPNKNGTRKELKKDRKGIATRYFVTAWTMLA
jgi:ribonuclease HI